MGHQQKDGKTERGKGLGRKIRKEAGKGNQMTVLRFQTGRGGRADMPGFSSGGTVSD